MSASIAAETLRQWLVDGKPVTVLDIRMRDDRAQWSIPGSVHIEAYNDLKQGRPGALADAWLPAEIPVVTICNMGLASQLAAQALAERGFEALFLEGGMKSWSLAWNTAQVLVEDKDLRIIQVRRTGKGCLSYVVSSRQEALVIDASLPPYVYRELAAQHGFRIRYVLDTHIHADHLSRSASLAQEAGATLLLTSIPGLADLSRETAATRKLYGLDEAETAEFGTQCLMARRMVERGVRFIQLYSGGNKGSSVGWDGHGQCNENHTVMAGRVDKPIAGLLADLKSRGLLEQTLVIWGGDFGRTPFTNGGAGASATLRGRDHNPYGFSVWLSGGGVKGGKVIGSTDEIGLHAAEDKVHVHDLHATILSLLGLDHQKLTYFFQGRDFRLTDVGGKNDLSGRLTS